MNRIRRALRVPDAWLGAAIREFWAPNYDSAMTRRSEQTRTKRNAEPKRLSKSAKIVPLRSTSLPAGLCSGTSSPGSIPGRGTQIIKIT
jgi:hypothetical protein